MRFNRRTFLIAGCGLVATPVWAEPDPSICPAGDLPAPLPPVLASTGKVRALYEKAIVIDGLGGLATSNFKTPPVSKLSPQDIANARASGVTAINMTLDSESLEAVAKSAGVWLEEIDKHPDTYLSIRSFADLQRAKASKKVGVIFGFQGIQGALGSDLERLNLYHGLGLRIIQLTYNDHCWLGDGCMVPDDQGLTPLGHEVVTRLNELRIVVDLSHAGVRTAREGLLASTRPPIVSHTGCRAVFNHPRCQTDEVLKTCADKGGVVGLFLMPYLGGDPVYPSRAQLLRHIEHALNLCGEDHVGIGSDLSLTPDDVTPEYQRLNLADVAARKSQGIYTPGDEIPPVDPDLNSPRKMELIAEGLDERGYPSRVVEKVIGGNFARVFKAVWEG